MPDLHPPTDQPNPKAATPGEPDEAPVIDRYAHASEAIVGARTHQEDHCVFAFAQGGPGDARTGERGTGELLAVLADGMGGHVAGETASQMVCARFTEVYASERTVPHTRLRAALEACNLSLAEAIAEDDTLDGMGCTLVGAVFGERGMRWVSVGDSHLYLFRARSLYLLNEDHSMAPVIDDMATRGLINNAEAQAHPQRHMLRSALTGGPIDMVDIGAKLLRLLPDDVVIIASDGIEALDHAAIASVIAEQDDGDPAAIVSALVDAVEAVGDPLQDNTTVMAIQPKFA
ncbi:MAG: protein phosphatase 2C domain-containing protein [Pseudomonadota bacterium]